MDDSKLTIGRLAQIVGVNVETVRYYQRLGIINEPPKPIQGYRTYPPQVVDRLSFIKRAQRLGFSLQEISELLELGDGHCDDVRQRAEAKRATIDKQIADLKTLRTKINELIQACHSGRDTTHCAIVQTLAKKHN
ncbi:MAG: MerR family DNA-binding protein [Gammaproteobacteria bacterium]|nr:MerR family DNA-binding protein [Gammaproteobacteria bacterium]